MLIRKQTSVLYIFKTEHYEFKLKKIFLPSHFFFTFFTFGYWRWRADTKKVKPRVFCWLAPERASSYKNFPPKSTGNRLTQIYGR